MWARRTWEGCEPACTASPLSPIAPVLGQRVPVRGPARLLFRSYAKTDCRPGASAMTLTTRTGDLFEVDLSSFLEWQLFAFGAFEGHFAELFRRLVRPGDRCLDVGANVGVHTVRLAKLSRAAGEVLAFEPDPELARRARGNVQLNEVANVRMIEAAAADHNSTAVLYRPGTADTNRARASLLHHTYLTGREQEVPTVTIDDSCPDPVALIKIDVEGAEAAVVAGAAATISRDRPAVIFEYAPQALRREVSSPFGWLAEQGYELMLIRCRRNGLTGRGRLVLSRLRELPGRGWRHPRHPGVPGAVRQFPGGLTVTTSAPPEITIFTRSYPPAYLAGGPARSLYGLVEALAAEFRFSVVTSALDGPAAGPMESVTPDTWSTFGHAATWYWLSSRRSARKAAALLRDSRPQVVYLNSLFDYRFSILPLLVIRLRSRRTPVILAPRGELSVGALTLKRRKKQFFLTTFRLLRLHKTVTWHASTGQEQVDIERVFGSGVRSHVAIDLRTGISCQAAGDDQIRRPSGESGGCSLIFFSRIVPKKNVATVIRALPLVSGDVRLSIAGPIEDTRYWDQCRALIDEVTGPGSVKYLGTVPADQVVSFLSRFDLFVLPTLGENFGHVVLESLAAGTPVIVGYDTPWRRVEAAGAGWLCDPGDPGEVARLIQYFLRLDQDARSGMREAARLIAAQMLDAPDAVAANMAMFHALTRRSGRPA